ncbi:MAG: integrase [Rhodospirillaceae bacterium]|nr:MAG: integrase [Rhodospirillaceae bacterium]
MYANKRQAANETPLTSDNTHLSEPITTALDGGAINCTQATSGYVRAAIADNTRRAYRADLNHFLEWGGAIPATDVMVADYLAVHAGALAVSTLCRRIASIAKAHRARGLQSPTVSDLIKATMRGIKRTHGAPQRGSAPLLIEDLLRIMSVLGDGMKDTRDRALLLLGFAGGFRRSELVALDVEDIQSVRQGMIVTIKRSKTDQAGVGRQIGVPFARGRFCPVKSVEAWLQVAGISDGPVFRSVDRYGRVGTQRLSSEAVANVIKARVEQVGFDPTLYSGHSLRAGLATSAAMAGVSSLDIRKQTGHASDAMLARYVRSGELFVNNASGALL